MPFEDIIVHALAAQPAAVCHEVTRGLHARRPDAFVLETEDCRFRLEDFALDGNCALVPEARATCVTSARWDALVNRTEYTADHGVWHVHWRGEDLLVLWLTYDPSNGTRRAWIVAPSRALAEAFFLAVCTWNDEVRGEILVFEGGSWHKSDELYDAIRGATFDELVLPAALEAQLREDFTGFFSSRAVYEQYRVPWKRGALFTGPPGNGKTHTIKALCNVLGRPVLYVKGLRSRHSTDLDGIREVFDRARRTAPCVLVFEDLDAIVDDGNRSFFLNEMDGFAGNTGLLTIASSNHPERLDPAIVQRPSRFDRRYAFELPARAERLRYVARWNEAAAADVALSEAGLARVADQTEGFSFAYLKELLLSSVMAWVRRPAAGTMDAVMSAQVDLLREQIKLPRAVDVPIGPAQNVGFIPRPAASRG